VDIPFNRPSVVGRELEYMSEALLNGRISGDGAFTRRCHTLFEERFGISKALLTTSCTHALEMSALLLDIKPGDEVIVPSFTFVTSANAFVLRGAKPVFVDIRADTLNLDERQLEGRLTERTKVIVPVHYAGVGCEMDSIMSLARARGVAVVEDNAQGLFGKYKGRWLGTFGDLSTVSFHETKNIVCGEGGALFINDPEHAARAEIIREKGTNRSQFFRGQVDKYSWVDLGSSYLPSDILAAFLYGQLERAEHIAACRKTIWERYATGLATWAAKSQVTLPTVPAHCEQTHHLFYLLLPSLDVRQRFIAHLREHRIQSVYHYVPLHTSEMGKRFGGRAGDCPITESVSDRLVRLPFFLELTEEKQDRIIEAIHAFEV
jgi:dTDP-4-amino-4,6-dideoxygalactose transaminase